MGKRVDVLTVALLAKKVITEADLKKAEAAMDVMTTGGEGEPEPKGK